MAYTNSDLYNIILDFIRKDRRGGVLTELEYQLELQRMNISYMETILPMYEKDKDITDKLSLFKKVIDGSGLTISSGRIAIPTDYIKHGYLHYRQDGSADKIRVLDELTDAQWSSRLGSSISTPTERFPVCIYREGYIDFIPSTMTKNYFEYSYIRYPNTPYFDGYYDVNGNFIYLGVGGSRVLVSGEVGLDGTVFPATYNSSTVELEWHDEDKLIIADMILRRLGVELAEPLITQFNDAIIKEK